MRKYCLNYLAQGDRRKASPIFAADKLRKSEHRNCEVHEHTSSGELAAMATCYELHMFGTFVR
jgi:hypothetical protein